MLKDSGKWKPGDVIPSFLVCSDADGAECGDGGLHGSEGNARHARGGIWLLRAVCGEGFAVSNDTRPEVYLVA